MTTIEGRTIVGEHLMIDGTRFIGCTLIGCVLGYEGGEIFFDSTRLRDCRYVFFGPSERTVHLLQEVGLMPYVKEEWGECFFPPEFP